MKYIIYCRKSTDTEDKQVLSLESQENELKQLAESLGIEVVEILRESMSAKSEGRPIFSRMIQRVISGEVDGILCWKLDRLARNFIDGGRIIDLLQKNVIKEIRTYEGVHLPSDNVLMLAVQLGMANQYIRDLSVNVKRGNRAKLERGEWPNHAPLGYKNDKTTKTVKVDLKKAKYVKRAYELYATGGYTLKDVSEQLHKEGFRTVSGRKVLRSQIHRILTSKFYIGLMERDGKIYQGNHKALVSTKLNQQVQSVFENRLHPKPKKHFYSARGFLSCANCGCTITADTKRGHQYYYCTNGKGICSEHRKYLRSDKIDEMLSKLFLELKFDKELIEISAEAYRQKNCEKESYTNNARQSLLDELESLNIKESTLTDGFASQIIKKSLYEEKMRGIENERVALMNQLKEIDRNGAISVATFEQIQNVFIDGNRASNEYLTSTDEVKRKLLEKLLSNVSIEKQNVAQYQFKSPYLVLAKAPKNGDLTTLLPDLDSNQDTRYQKP